MDEEQQEDEEEEAPVEEEEEALPLLFTAPLKMMKSRKKHDKK